MLEASGECAIGESRGASWLLSKRVSGMGLAGYLISLCAIFAVELLTSFVLFAVAPAAVADVLSLPLIVGAGLGSLWLWLRWRRARLRKGWEARGVTNPHPVTFRIEDAVFVVVSGHSEIRCRWGAISEIARSRHHWIYIGYGLGYCLPRRFFGDVVTEREFLNESLQRMDDAARRRSRQASAFVEAGEGK
ncbi:YcxB family protein [Phenylobacterium sp.]|jgi:hypothetical protein|uniref:YcxB family protein n=1 Tax=Phenylobacterium sp. TaxID=1871053 RepID=UPI002F40DA76